MAVLLTNSRAMNSWAMLSITAVSLVVDRLIDGAEMQVRVGEGMESDGFLTLQLNPEMTAEDLVLQLRSKFGNRASAAQHANMLVMEVFGDQLEFAPIQVTVMSTETEDLVSEWNWENSGDHDASLLQRMPLYWEQAIQMIAAQPCTTLQDCTLILAEDRALFDAVYGAKQEWPDALLVHERLERIVIQQPDAVAVHSSRGTLTYAELNQRAEQAARELLRLGVTRGQVVALYLDRSPEYVIAVVAVVKVGAAVLPLDPVFPVERVAYVLQDAGVVCVLTHSDLAGDLPESAVRLLLDQMVSVPDGETFDAVLLDGSDLAYLIYTSGSTGQPKGVELLHAGFANFMNANRQAFDLGTQDRMTLLAGTAFDASQFELWLALTTGATLYIPDAHLRLQPAGLVRYLIDQEITFCFLPTPLGERVLLEEWPEQSSIRHLMTGGDQLHPIRRAFPFAVHNLYGPTEATVGTTYETLVLPMLGADMPKIGRPFANMTVHVLDRQKRPVPIGVPGELYIGGIGLARGYRSRPDLTERAFVDVSLLDRPAERLYKTGDRVRLDADGRLTFLGRLDQQVKVRGFRIEVGEIEARILELPTVKEVVVVTQGDQHDKQLVAYVMLSSEQDFEEQAVRQELMKTLPVYMLPTVYVVLSTFPLTSNGKIDRRALPAPATVAGEAEELYSMEGWLADCWQEVLGSRHIDKSSKFFALGGHSLHAAQLIARIRQALSIELPMEVIFEDLTLEGLAMRLESSKQEQPAWDEIVRTEGEVQPLSSSQQRLWFLDQLQPENNAYNLASLYELKGQLDPKNLEQSFQALLERHHVLRMKFKVEAGKPMQALRDVYEFTLPLYDLRGFGAEQEEQAKSWAEQFVARPFRLQEDLFLRAALIQLDHDRYWLVIAVHHIASDGWSQDLLVEEFGFLYSAIAADRPSSLGELPLQYQDYAGWQQRTMKSDRIKHQLHYWKQALQGVPQHMEWKDSRPRPVLQTFAGAHHSLPLPLHIVQRVEEWCRQEGVTLYAALLSAYCVLLQRYSAQDDFLIGTPVANRHFDPRLESLIGFFANTLLMRVSIQGTETFRDLVHQVMETSIQSLVHQDVPFEMLVEELQPERDTSRNPLFQAGFAFQNLRNSPLELTGLEVTKKIIETHSSIVDLTLFVTQRENELVVEAEYNIDLWEAEMIGRLLAQYQTVLESVIDDPECSLCRIVVLSDEDKQKLTALNRSCDAEPLETLCLHRSVEQHASSNPKAIAVVAENGRLTYEELNRAANRLDRQLQANGIKCGMPVGVCAGRTTWMVVGILAALKVGAVYVPLDSNYPQGRLDDMVEDSGMRIVLADYSSRDSVSFNPLVQVLELDEADTSAQDAELQPLPIETSADDVAYMIYTSGSTGRPKGVCCTHSAVQEMIADIYDRQPLTSQDCGSVWTSFSFDVSVYEIFSVLTVGAALHIASDTLRYQGNKFAEWLVEQGITSAYIPPFMLAEIRDVASRHPSAAHLRRLLVGVEPISERLLADIARMVPGLVIINGYGPTESTICCTLFTLDPERVQNRNVPIGRPVRNTTVCILDKNQQLVPVGVPGELYVGGAGLATGYWNNPALTNEKFVELSIDGAGSTRLYRTGDLVRLLPSGDLEFIGRMDFQVKIRGYRIELGEIENVLKQQPTVKEALVTVHRDQEHGDQLFAYVVPELPLAELQRIREALRKRLPAFMVPAAIQSMLAYPITPNGKVDRKSLPVPEWNRSAGIVEVPQTKLEKMIHQIWQDVLGIAEFSLDDNFFDLGGHSMLMSILHVQLQEKINRPIALLDLFQYPTIRSLVSFLHREETVQQKTELSEVAASGRAEVLHQQRLRRQQSPRKQ